MVLKLVTSRQANSGRRHLNALKSKTFELTYPNSSFFQAQDRKIFDSKVIVLYKWGRGFKIDPRNELRYDIIKYSNDIFSSHL